jgi:ornithine--oxo-acid transaminase
MRKAHTPKHIEPFETYADREYQYLPKNYHPLDLVVLGTDGAHLMALDKDNKVRKMLDGMACYSAANFGHNHPRIQAVAKKLTRELSPNMRSDWNDARVGDLIPNTLAKRFTANSPVSRGVMNPYLGKFAQEVCTLTGQDQFMPCNGGAEAVETAIKAARRWGYEQKKIPSNQAKIIVMGGNFHGRTSTIVGFSEAGDDIKDVETKKDFGPYVEDAFIEVPFGDITALQVAMENSGNIAAIIMEPIQGEAGVLIPPAGYIKAAYDLCKQNNVLFILDEIQSGMGRTGKNFAYEHELPAGQHPDGIILGKALGGGMLPVSGFAARKDVMDGFRTGSHGSTFGGNALAAAIGYESLRILQEENMAQASAKKGRYIFNGLTSLRYDHSFTDIRGRGLWLGLDIDPAKGTAQEFCEIMAYKHGVFCKATGENAVRLSPPLIIEQSDMDHLISAIYATAKEMRLSPKADTTPKYSYI